MILLSHCYLLISYSSNHCSVLTAVFPFFRNLHFCCTLCRSLIYDVEMNGIIDFYQNTFK